MEPAAPVPQLPATGALPGYPIAGKPATEQRGNAAKPLNPKTTNARNVEAANRSGHPTVPLRVRADVSVLHPQGQENPIHRYDCAATVTRVTATASLRYANASGGRAGGSAPSREPRAPPPAEAGGRGRRRTWLLNCDAEQLVQPADLRLVTFALFGQTTVTVVPHSDHLVAQPVALTGDVNESFLEPSDLHQGVRRNVRRTIVRSRDR